MDLSTGVPVSIQLKRLSNKAMNKKIFLWLRRSISKMGDTLYIRYKEELLEDTEPTP